MKCGFSKKDITPPNDCCLAGYPHIRMCEGIVDPLYVRCVAFEENGLALLLCFDLEGVNQLDAQVIREYVAQQVGCETKNILVSGTHTHTGPNLYTSQQPQTEYLRTYLKYLATSAAEGAIADLKEASFSFARDQLPGITFVRRYRMKDGTVKTNPGRHNPEVLEPMSPPDETIQLLKITRKGAGDIAIVNFQVHPDIRGGNMISADYPGVVCNTVEGALPGTDCFYMNGACGDLNHIDVNCPEWDKNSGPEHSVHVGRAIAGKILSMYTKARPIATGPVRTAVQTVTHPRRPHQPEKMAQALEFIRKYEEGTIDRSAYPGMELATAYYDYMHTIERANQSDTIDFPVSGVAMGDLCITGIPGEAFCAIGRDIRETSPFAAHMVSGITNGYEGYFPTKDAFGVTGYESRTSPFQPGVGEAIAEGSKILTRALFTKA